MSKSQGLYKRVKLIVVLGLLAIIMAGCSHTEEPHTFLSYFKGFYSGSKFGEELISGIEIRVESVDFNPFSTTQTATVLVTMADLEGIYIGARDELIGRPWDQTAVTAILLSGLKERRYKRTYRLKAEVFRDRDRGWRLVSAYDVVAPLIDDNIRSYLDQVEIDFPAGPKDGNIPKNNERKEMEPAMDPEMCSVASC